MPRFGWPELRNDVALAREVASTRPTKSADWEITGILSAQFSTKEKPVDLKGRGYSKCCWISSNQKIKRP